VLTTLNPRRLAGTAAVLLIAASASSQVASAHTPMKAAEQPAHLTPLVIRGEDTVSEPVCQPGLCTFELTGGSFRGTPVGTGTYSGSTRLHIADAFPNGEGGVCAPVDGSLEVDATPADHLVIALRGDSCQDGAGDPHTSSFTTLARFKVIGGTGRYMHARGRGVASFLEDAQDHEHVTLTGRIAT
jgi:hypothetical protein